MNTYHATPYDIAADGFYFETWEEYADKASRHRNQYGQPVEEFEIQFIDGSEEDCRLFNAFDVHQGTLKTWLEEFEGEYADTEDVVKALHAIDLGYGLDNWSVDLDDLYVFEGTPAAYAESYLEDTGVLDAVEKAGLLSIYIDVEAFARDMELAGAFTKFEYGHRLFLVQGDL